MKLLKQNMNAIVICIFEVLVVAFLTDKALTTEILSIIGSFSLWEAANSFLLERPRLRWEYEKPESVYKLYNETN